MATQQTVPNADGVKKLNITRRQFDLDQKKDVDLVKVVEFKPVADMAEFAARLGNDSKRILEIVNDGLEEFTKKQASEDSQIPWYEMDEEGEIKTDENKQPVVFNGTLLTDEKAKQFNATVLSMAKMMFGYPDQKLPKGAS